jgi:hypothetical protein
LILACPHGPRLIFRQCDEGQPQCARCLSKGEVCEYNQLVQRHFTVVNERFTGTHKPAIQQAGKKAAASRGAVKPTPPQAIRSTSPTNDLAISGVGAGLLARNSTEARILEHFHTLGPFRNTINAPNDHPLSNARSGFSFFLAAVRRNLAGHDFLRNGIYSFSALHLALTDGGPDRQELLNAALRYEIQGLAAFQPHLHCITKENCEAAILFSTVLSMCALATPVTTGRIAGDNRGRSGTPPDSAETAHPSEAIHQIIKIIKLFRGTKALADMALRCSPDTNLGEFWRRRALTAPEAPYPAADASLDRFETLLDAQMLDPVLRDAYAWAVLTLRRCLRRGLAEPNVPYLVIIWASMTKPEFISELDAAAEPALVVLAHWAVSLHKLSEHFWASGWGRWVMQAVCKTIRAPEWRTLLYWPMREIGLQPEDEGIFEFPVSADVIDPALVGEPTADWSTQGLFMGTPSMQGMMSMPLD